MFCPECGAKNDEEALFCVKCGADLNFAVPEEDEMPETAMEEPERPEPEAEEIPEEEEIYEEEPVSSESAVLGPDDDYYEEELAKLEAIYGVPEDDEEEDDEEEEQPTVRARRTRRHDDDDDYIEPRKPRRRRRKGGAKVLIIALVELIAVAAAAYGIYTQLLQRFGAEAVAENYFVSLVNGDYSEAYGLVDLQSTEMTTENIFRSVMTRESCGEVASCKTEFDGEKTVTVIYTLKEGEAELKKEIPMVKAGTRYGILDNWKVDAASLLAKEYTLEVLTGASVYVDGTSLPEIWRSSEAGGVDTYVIPTLFCGTHTVSVSMEGRTPLDQTLLVSGDGEGADLTAMGYTEATLNKVAEKAGKDMQALYTAAAAGEDFNAVAAMFTGNAESLPAIKEGYKALVDFLHSEDILNVYFENMPVAGDVDTPDVTVSFEYAVDYEKVDDKGYIQVERTKDKGTASFSYIQENGAYVLTAFPCKPLSYK